MPPQNPSDPAITLAQLLSKLPEIKLEVKQVSQRLQDLPIETQLMTLSEVSIERETEAMKDILTAKAKA
jgi:hypothetical protein